MDCSLPGSSVHEIFQAWEGFLPVRALSQSSAPQGLLPGSWAAGSLGVYWVAGQGKGLAGLTGGLGSG